jgi:CRP-like cAMP-binding protein
MYSKPRAATVKAAKDGVLWAMDRRSFRNILMKSTGRSIMKTLRSVDVLKSLSVGQLQRLCDVLTEVTYDDGEYVIKQGETSDTFYIIVEGKAVCTKRNDPANMSEKPQHLMELGEGQYFGARARALARPLPAHPRRLPAAPPSPPLTLPPSPPLQASARCSSTTRARRTWWRRR